MLTINLICVGKLKENYLKDAAAEYVKRLAAFCKLNIHEIEEDRLVDNPSPSQINMGLEAEGKKILSKIPQGSKIIPLCIEGKLLTSEELATDISTTAIGGTSNISFIIGGSYGLSEEVKKVANVSLSLSKMTFPHQLARIMLLEQIYRSFTIISNKKYHK